MMRKLLKGVGGAVVALAMMISLTCGASANYYGVVGTSNSMDGAYFYAVTQPLDSKWANTAAAKNRFILHTTWIRNESSSGLSWIEVGFVDGAMDSTGSGNPTHHNGFYTATGAYNANGALIAYDEYFITGPGTATGLGHTYQIQRTGYSSWGVYVDYNLCHTYYDFATSCTSAHVGLETNYAGSTSSQWNERAFQILKNGSWQAWSSGSVVENDTNDGISVSWESYPTSIFTKKT